MLITYLFRYRAYFRMRHLIRYRSQFFKIFFCLRTSNAGVAVRTADGSRRTANAGDEQWLRCACSSPSCTVIRCYLPPGRCWRRAMSEVWMQQSVTYSELWCFVLQTTMDRCAQLVLHPVPHPKPVAPPGFCNRGESKKVKVK